MAETPGLHYDRDSDRWCLHGTALHCGDGLQVRVGGHWLQVRIKYHDTHRWVLHADSDTVRILPGRSLPARPDPRDYRR